MCPRVRSQSISTWLSVQQHIRADFIAFCFLGRSFKPLHENYMVVMGKETNRKVSFLY